jgi:hypothetical protein
MSPKKRKAKIALPQPKKTKGRRGSRAYLMQFTELPSTAYGE